MKKQTGYTLIEIMIALILGLIVLGAAINIYIATVGSSSNIIKSARLNHDLESVMALMVNDIKRSGYWGGANVAADSRVNTFTAAATNIQIHTISTTDDCILYSYDGGSGSTGGVPHGGNGIADADEYYGFKLENNSIKIRTTGTTTDIAGCAVANQNWEEFIDNNQLTITALQFSFAPIDIASTALNPDLPATSRCLNITTNAVTNAAACAGATAGDNLVEKRLVNIQLTGRVTSDSTVTKTLNGTVEVRNSRVRIQ